MEAKVTTPAALHRRLLPGPWSRRRIAGESVLCLALAGLAVPFESVNSDGGVPILVAALCVAVLCLLRVGLPATVLVITAALSAGLGGAVPMLVCASWSGGKRIDRPRRAIGAFAAALVLHSTIAVVSEPLPFSLGTEFAISAAFFLAASVVPGLISRYRAQRRLLLYTLQQHNEQLLRERALVAGQARMRERNRIAQDMHDSLGHQLALIAVHTGALQVDDELTGRQREAVGVLREASVAAMHELRDVVGILRDETREARDSGGGGDAGGSGGEREGPEGGRREAAGVQALPRAAAAVDRLVESSRATGASVELRRVGEPCQLAPTTEQAAYRIAQEGLTNVHKHAPGAPVTVTLRYEPDSLVVEVANGPAPEAALAAAGTVVSGGQGLTGLEERARLVGGIVHSGPTPGGGFRLAGVLPYSPGDRLQRPAAPAPACAPFVDASDDFRRQTAPAPLGDGGPVIDRSDLSREFNAAMTSKKNVALGCAAAFVVLAGGVVLLAVWGVVKLLDEVDKATIDPDVYQSVEVGQPSSDVDALLPEGSGFLTDGLESEGPKRPEGASCRHFLSSETQDDLDKERVFRFCFKNGKLIEKEVFEARH